MSPYEELGFAVVLLTSGTTIVWIVTRYFIARAQERDRRNRIVEEQFGRFADADSFVAFARSDVGRDWLLAETGATRVMIGALLLGVTGAVLGAVGTGLLTFGAGWLAPVGAEWTADQADALFWGCVLLPTGLTMIGSSVVTARLGRAWGLVPRRRSRDDLA